MHSRSHTLSCAPLTSFFIISLVFLPSGTNQQGSRPGTVGSAMGGGDSDFPSRPTTSGGIEAGQSLATGGTLGTLSGRFYLLSLTQSITVSNAPF